MLKKVGVEHLRLGMYVHELCGSWMDHPFWRTRFELDDAEDIRRLREKVEIDPANPALILTVPGVGYRLVTSPVLSP